ncbi:hypothetical protein XENOCAPTIV_027282, partial [Xenoophorus captivus]
HPDYFPWRRKNISGCIQIIFPGERKTFLGCDLGEHCAIRKGSRIGKMCDCPTGAFCNLFLLKCL